MKNLKTKRIILIALSLMLLIGSVIGITVSAANDDTYEIKSINIAYGDKAYVLMAVDASVEDAAAGNVEVTYSIGDNNYTATYWPELTANAEKNPSGLPVFYTVGIAPKDIGEDIIAEAHVKGATNYTPVYENISLAEYLYHMLYAKGRINATDGTELHAKAVYENLLAYGAAAQQYFWNDKAENATNQRELVTNRSYVYVDGATINATGENELLLPGKTGTVTLVPASNVVSWNVTTYDENGTATTTSVIGNEIAVEGHTVITPVTATIRGNGSYANDARTERYENFTATSNANFTVNNWNGTTAYTKLLSDVEGKYLNIGRNGANNGNMRIKLDTSDDITAKNTHVMMVFETDILWGGANEAMYGGNLAFLRFYYDNSTSNFAEAYTMPITADGKLTIKSQNGTSVATLDVGEWYNVRIEIIDNKSSLYLNGELISSASPFSTSNDMKITHVQFEPRVGTSIVSGLDNANNVFDIAFDNTFAARVAADNARGYGKYANDENYASLVESYESFTSTSNSNYTVTDWNGTTKWTKLKSDVEGKYLNVGRNGADNSNLTIKTTTVDESFNKIVFETDIMWGGASEALYGQNIAFLRFYDSTQTNIGDYFTMPITSDGKLTIKDYNATDVATLEIGAWYNLRIEIIDGRVTLYLNNEVISSVAPFSGSNDMKVENVVFNFRTGSAMGNATGADNAFNLSLDNTFAARIAEN